MKADEKKKSNGAPLSRKPMINGQNYYANIKNKPVSQPARFVPTGKPI